MVQSSRQQASTKMLQCINFQRQSEQIVLQFSSCSDACKPCNGGHCLPIRCYLFILLKKYLYSCIVTADTPAEARFCNGRRPSAGKWLKNNLDSSCRSCCRAMPYSLSATLSINLMHYSISWCSYNGNCICLSPSDKHIVVAI